MAVRGHTGGGAGKRRYSQGGRKKRKNYIDIDFSAFERYAEQLEQLEADLKPAFSEAMEEAGLKVAQDTRAAVQAANLPATGKYSDGATRESIITNPKVTWSGDLGELPLGFDKTKPGSGGWLITGTPFMRPDYALEKIYGSKGYERQIRNLIEKKLQETIDKRMGK
jgi:hypothetical protein